MMLQTIKNCQECLEKKANLNSLCVRCRTINTAYQRYAESNIPVRYWDIEMNDDFKGDSVLLTKYKEITNDLSAAYKSGVSLCFAGNHGIGKSCTALNILKRAVEKGYTCHYSTLSDIVSALITSDSQEKYISRNQLLTVDFLVVDEFDPRFMGSENAADLYGRILEDIFRTRSQNLMPIIMCTNSPNVIESFHGPIKKSIESLMNYVKIIPVIGKDFRKTESGK